MTRPSHAIVFVTHVRSARVAAYLERLRRETQHLLPVFVCVDERRDRADTLPGFPADLKVDMEAAEHVVPARTANGGKVGYFPHYDLFYVPALIDPKLAAFDYLWMMEADVDFAGDWGTFFEAAMHSTADLLATTIYPRPIDPRWPHWHLFGPPANIAQEFRIRAFLPLSRYSRRLLSAFVEETNAWRWKGIYEAVFPSLAFSEGWEIGDFGGSGPFKWEGPSFYWNTFKENSLSPGTFTAGDPRYSYFHEDPDAFPERGQIYHPVKGWDPPYR